MYAEPGLASRISANLGKEVTDRQSQSITSYREGHHTAKSSILQPVTPGQVKR